MSVEVADGVGFVFVAFDGSAEGVDDYELGLGLVDEVEDGVGAFCGVEWWE